MHHVVDLLFNPRLQRLSVIAALLMVSSLVLGEGGAVATAGDEPGGLSGFIIAAIIFNISMATLILVLLRKEWNKHKTATRQVLNDKCEGK